VHRIFALLAGIAVFCAAHAQSGTAQVLSGTAQAPSSYPNRPIRLITPFSPGGAIDIYARTIAEPLGKSLGQNVIVEAVPGANTISGTQQLVRAAPDGYTFMVTTMSTVVSNRILFTKLPYDPDKDLAPITQLSYGTVLFSGPGNAPYNGLKEFIAWARTKDRVTYGSWGVASWGHLAGRS